MRNLQRAERGWAFQFEVLEAEERLERVRPDVSQFSIFSSLFRISDFGFRISEFKKPPRAAEIFPALRRAADLG